MGIILEVVSDFLGLNYDQHGVIHNIILGQKLHVVFHSEVELVTSLFLQIYQVTT